MDISAEYRSNFEALHRDFGKKNSGTEWLRVYIRNEIITERTWV